MHTFIIEHMEPDEVSTPQHLPPWVQLEYKQIVEVICAKSRVIFSHLTEATAKNLQKELEQLSTANENASECLRESIQQLMEHGRFKLDQICLLDPKASQELSPADADQFDAFLFGGILGDDPPRDRTAELRKLGFPARHLGSVQMTTDTAACVTARVIDGQVALQDIPFIDHPTITFNTKESVDMPFRYIVQDNKPIMPKGMIELLKKDLDKSFDF